MRQSKFKKKKGKKEKIRKKKLREKGSFMWQVAIVYGLTDFKIFRLGLGKRSDTSFILYNQPFS